MFPHRSVRSPPLSLPNMPDLERGADARHGPTAPSSCTGCMQLDRRGFLSAASLVSLGALMAACGDGTIGGPTEVPGIALTPLRVDPRLLPSLSGIGGRAVITPIDGAPMVVERLSASQFRAFLLACPHKGTTVDVVGDGFLCPNHAARFNRDGRWLSGQETTDLVPVGVAVQADGTLIVGGLAAPPLPPALVLNTRAIAFVGSTTGADPAPQSVALSNGGDGSVTGLSVSLAYGVNQPVGWLAVQLNAVSAPAAITLIAKRGAIAAGTYAATVTVSASGVESQQVIATLIVQDPNSPQSLQLSSTSVALNAVTGASPATQTVQVLNSGSGTIVGLAAVATYGAGATGWLSTSSLNVTTAPAVLTLRAITTALAAGTYTATVQVSGTGVALRAIAVTLVVGTPGLAVTIANFPSLANIGGVAGSVGMVNGGPVALARASATTFLAFSMRCTHAGTTVNTENFRNSGSAFHCPNHGALFDNAGVVLPSSPIRTTPLTQLKVTYTPGAAVLYIG